jgi:hypothetical protein
MLDEFDRIDWPDVALNPAGPGLVESDQGRMGPQVIQHSAYRVRLPALSGRSL